MKSARTGLIVLLFVVSVTCDSTTSAPASTKPDASTTESGPATTPATTQAATTATPVPSTTSAMITTSKPTEKPTTPEPAPTPAPAPQPPVLPTTDSKFPEPVTFKVTVENDANVTCLEVKMAAQFVLVNQSEYLNLANASRADDSSCKDINATQINLKLTFGGNNVSFVFKRNKELTSAWLDQINLDYHVANETAPKQFNLGKQKLFESNGTEGIGKVYHCKSETESAVVDDVKVVFKEVEVQVGPGGSPDTKTCVRDEDVNDMIPIAVGAALLALVAIVLVAYFVGRRRSRRLAYQSV